MMILILALISCGFIIEDITTQKKPPLNNCMCLNHLHMFPVPSYPLVSFEYNSWHDRNHAGGIIGIVGLECFQQHLVCWDRA